MRKKQVLDISIIISEIAGIIMVNNIVEDINQKTGIIVAMFLVALTFFVVLFRDSRQYLNDGHYQQKRDAISQIMLLSEENTVITCWDIYGKTSIVFGRDENEQKMSMGMPIDIDLKDTAFAGAIDREHAVMNYYNGEWYLEDLESENGVAVQKGKDADKCKIFPGSPCQITQGDVIHLGMTKLKVR